MISSRKKKEKGTFPFCFTSLGVTLITKPAKNSSVKENYRIVSLMDIDFKFLRKY